jgi:predicted NBD/HSP70 family sugar kinase
MQILVVDIGGSNVKLRATGEPDKRKSESGPTMGPIEMLAKVHSLTADWKYDVVTIGYPGLVRQGRIVRDAVNLAPGWVGFHFQAALDRPVKIMNDAAMQALGSYAGGRMLFLGLGTGLGSALVTEWHVVSLALGDLPYRRGRFDDYLNKAALRKRGLRRWKQSVFEAVAILRHAFEADYVVLGGGNVDKLDELPEATRRGDNENAFAGGVRIWDDRYSASPEAKEAQRLAKHHDIALPVET